MGALGLLGSDATALKLAPMVRAWPGESQHQRAVLGLECLRAIGTDVALMQLNGIAQKLSFKGLKAKAAEMMEAIARDRGLSRTDLEDRIVPDCDLDERGGRDFEFGPRQFRFALGGDMKPMVRDETGKLRDDLPKPGVKDDAAKAAAAVEAWKQLKKQVREVAKVQAERLERAMVAGRRWTPADFESLLVRHPLMINLVRLVVWGGFDEKGRLISSFRVTEERDYADVDEATYRLDGLAAVGIVHPMHLTDAQRSAWGEILGDYEIIPPFPQLGRTVHRLEPEELGRKEIVRIQGDQGAGLHAGGDPRPPRLEPRHPAGRRAFSRAFQAVRGGERDRRGRVRRHPDRLHGGRGGPGSGTLLLRAGYLHAEHVPRAQTRRTTRRGQPGGHERGAGHARRDRLEGKMRRPAGGTSGFPPRLRRGRLSRCSCSKDPHLTVRARGVPMSRREFQLVEGESRKFWAIDLDGVAHTVSFGRIGTAGQSQAQGVRLRGRGAGVARQAGRREGQEGLCRDDGSGHGPGR